MKKKEEEEEGSFYANSIKVGQQNWHVCVEGYPMVIEGEGELKPFTAYLFQVIESSGILRFILLKVVKIEDKVEYTHHQTISYLMENE